MPPILYNPNQTIGKIPADNSDSLKFNIKMLPGERDSETVAIHMLLFCTGSPESLLKFVMILNKII